MVNTLNKLQLLDVVALKSSLPEHHLLAGHVGTIVELLAPDVYEVDFSDDEGQTYAMLSLHTSQLLKLCYAPETNMDDLHDLIRNIQNRPAMYLGQPSLDHLRTFLAGYFFARRQLGAPQTKQEKQFSHFQTWTQQKFNIPSSQSWDKIILFFSQDEHAALEQFLLSS